jgi:hypothetical protein
MQRLDKPSELRDSSGSWPPDNVSDAHRPGSQSLLGKARKETQMRMSFGCGGPHESHGDKRNIVYADLKKAADASKTSVKEAVRNIEKDAPDQESSFACWQMTPQ